MMHVRTVGAAEDYFGRQFSGFVLRERTISHEPEAELRKVKLSSLPVKFQRTFRNSNSVVAMNGPTAVAPALDADYLAPSSVPTALDDVRGVLRSFAELTAGWDGPDSTPARPGVIDNALEVLQNWSGDMDIPEPVMTFDGSVALEIYDEKGFTRGGVEFKGEHRAVFTVISETDIVSSGTFNASLLSEIIRSIHCIRQALSTEK